MCFWPKCERKATDVNEIGIVMYCHGHQLLVDADAASGFSEASAWLKANAA